jgi:hypothetical protein
MYCCVRVGYCCWQLNGLNIDILLPSKENSSLMLGICCFHFHVAFKDVRCYGIFKLER